MSTPLWIVDAFTERAFGGNPAAVCLMESPAPDEWMQNLAAEMNISETAFVWPEENGFRLRWMTPKVEVDLCGHATLASAHALWESGKLDAGTTAVFNTRSGTLTAEREGDWIALDFPSLPSEPKVATADLLAAIGAEPVWAGTYKMDWLIELRDADSVRRLSPDFAGLKGAGLRGVAVTARSDSGEFDFVSRFFAPSAGVDEDPVTGSMHCGLAPYWAAKLGKTELVGRQVSVRGGIVRCEVNGDRVRLLGQAVTVVRGVLASEAMP